MKLSAVGIRSTEKSLESPAESGIRNAATFTVWGRDGSEVENGEHYIDYDYKVINSLKTNIVSPAT